VVVRVEILATQQQEPPTQAAVAVESTETIQAQMLVQV
jgi:hypothetical protein